jgi:hypothetical protein
MFKALLHDYENGTETAKRWYERYNAEVQRVVPREKLLVMNVKEGWEPLCRFLGHEVPQRPVPRRNDRVTFDRNSRALQGLIEVTMRQRTYYAALLAGGVVVGMATAAIGVMGLMRAA